MTLHKTGELPHPEQLKRASDLFLERCAEAEKPCPKWHDAESGAAVTWYELMQDLVAARLALRRISSICEAHEPNVNHESMIYEIAQSALPGEVAGAK